jgi:hypothetical protein
LSIQQIYTSVCCVHFNPHEPWQRFMKLWKTAHAFV